MTRLPRTNDLNDAPDPDAVWAWPDGHLHPTPPLPVARISFIESSQVIPIPGWWVDIEAEPCGDGVAIEAAETADGQERRFLCDRPKGHTDRDRFAEDEPTHRCVTDNAGGITVVWVGGAVGLPGNLWRGRVE